MYKLSYSKSALKNLMKIPENVQKRIVEKLNLLKVNPYFKNNNIKKLEGLEGYRLRIGNYRIIYRIENQDYKILVIEIDVRGEVYK
jgi:mRNA interferase RelE/StbE